MKIYGYTMVSSEDDILVTDETGITSARSSYTKVFLTPDECIKDMEEKYHEAFSGYGFEGNEDADGNMELMIFKWDYLYKNGVTIQGSYAHTNFELFEQDLPYDIINRNDYIATKLWCGEDVAAKLDERGIEPTEENIAAVINTGFLKGLGDCTDDDWAIIDYAISEALG